MTIKLSFIIILLFQILSFNIVLLEKSNYHRKQLLFIGFSAIILESLLFFSIVDLSYGDDLIGYQLWFHKMGIINTVLSINTHSKAWGFSVLLYYFNFFSSSFRFFFVSVGLFSIFLIYIVVNAFEKTNPTIYFFYISLIFILNRYQLDFSANILRSFISGGLLLIILIYAFDNYKYLLLLPIPFLIHDLQFLLGLAIFILAYIIPFKTLRLIVIFAVLGYFINYLGNYFITTLGHFIKMNKINISAVITGSQMLTFSRKLQNLFYLVIPILIVLKNLHFSNYDKQGIKTKIFIKVMFISIGFAIFLVNITPRYDRIMLIGLPLLYIFFLKFSGKWEKFFFVNAIIIMNFVALLRNVSHFNI